ncbi:MAG: hypothetical protein ABEJ28_12365 [Salinigranum sp.]
MSTRTPVTMSPRAYRFVDRLTKLLGVVLVAAALELGGGTPTGLVLGALGVAFGLSTVFIEREA